MRVFTKIPKNLHDRCSDLAARRGFTRFEQAASDAIEIYLARWVHLDFDLLEAEKRNDRHPAWVDLEIPLSLDGWQRLRARCEFRSPTERAIVRRSLCRWEQ